MKETEVLSEFCSSVFTIETGCEIPRLKDKLVCEKLMDFDISIT